MTVLIALIVSVPESGTQTFAAYERRVLPLLGRYGGSLERSGATAEVLVVADIAG
jgi:hypothetical protein